MNKFVPSFRAFILMMLCASLAACNHTVPSLHTVRTVNVKLPEEFEETDMYGDKTSAVTKALGYSLGPGGILVLGTASAINSSKGRKRWAGVVKSQEQVVRNALKTSMERELKRAFGWIPDHTAQADAEFSIDGVCYGVSHDRNDRFRVLLAYDSYLYLPKVDYDYWAGEDEIDSDSAWTVEEYKANPQLFAKAMQEAADKIAVNVVAGIRQVQEAPKKKRRENVNRGIR